MKGVFCFLPLLVSFVPSLSPSLRPSTLSRKIKSSALGEENDGRRASSRGILFKFAEALVVVDHIYVQSLSLASDDFDGVVSFLCFS